MAKQPSVFKKALSKWESRKMQLWLIVFITSTFMYFWGDKVTFKEWSDFAMYCLGIFVFGNGVEYVSGAMKGTNGQTQQPQPQEEQQT